MPTILATAAMCSALIMGTAPALPDRYIPDVPGPNFCEFAGHPGCVGIFIAWADGTTTIVAPPYFDLLVQETCHSIQYDRDGEVSDPECDAVMARAGECIEAAGQ